MMTLILLLLINLYYLSFNIVYTEQVKLEHELGIEWLIKNTNSNLKLIDEKYILSNLPNLNNTFSNILNNLSKIKNEKFNLLNYKTLLKNASDKISSEIGSNLNDHFDVLDNINDEWKKINALIVFHDPNSDLAISHCKLYNRLNSGSIENSIEFLNIFSHKNKDCLIKKLNELLKRRYESQNCVLNKIIYLKKILIEIECTKMIYLYNNKKPNSNMIEIMIPKFLKMFTILDNLIKLSNGNFEKPHEISIIKVVNMDKNDTPIPDKNFIVYPNLNILLGFDDDSCGTDIKIYEVNKNNCDNYGHYSDYLNSLNINDLYSVVGEYDDFDSENFDGRYNSLDKFKLTLHNPDRPKLIDDNFITNKEEDLDDDDKVSQELKRFFRKLSKINNKNSNSTSHFDIMSSLSPNFLDNLFSDEHGNITNLNTSTVIFDNKTNVPNIEKNVLLNKITKAFFNEIGSSLNNGTNNLDIETHCCKNKTCEFINETDIVFNVNFNFSSFNNETGLINKTENLQDSTNSSNFLNSLKSSNSLEYKDKFEYKNRKLNNKELMNSIKKKGLSDYQELSIADKKCLSSLYVCPVVRHLTHNEMLKFDRSLFTYKEQSHLERDKIIIWLVSESLVENYGARVRLLELITLKIMEINRVVDRSAPIMNLGNEKDENIKFYREKQKKILLILNSLKHFLNSENSFDIANRRISFLELFVPTYSKELIQKLNDFDSNHIIKQSNTSTQSNKEHFFKLRSSQKRIDSKQMSPTSFLLNESTYSEPSLPELCTRFIAIISITKSVNSFCDNSYKFGQKVCSMIFETPIHNLLSSEDYSWLTGISLMKNINGLIKSYKLPEALYVSHKNVLRALNYALSQKIYNMHQACTQSLISQKNTVIYQKNVSIHIIKSIFKIACAEFFGISLFLYEF